MSDVITTPQGVTYHPWTDGYAVGYRVEHGNGKTEFIYLNPSSDSDNGAPNVFVYIGPHGDPAHDPPSHFYDLARDTPSTETL